ncbi:ABC transporter ATP-binding protein [Candidatus Bipolaricaulota bacterium]|nr:ABC transporter ATP-binding protein [Candidatus Bipolaricaulota bacterium]MCK4599033.1 ABC transporter ATP-binding protein [Candidatus Bipolaricaulota bacterium]
MSEPLLTIQNLHVGFDIYGGHLKVLDGVNFAVGKGEKVGLVGETGCGKTTTMKSVMRILPMPPGKITDGEIVYKGRDLLRVNLKKVWGVKGKGISMIFQDPTAALNPVFTIGRQLMDVVKYSRDTGKDHSGDNIRERAIRALKDVAMPDPERILSNYPIQLSGGMRQRICIAMALVTGSELLIADEPTTSLDVTIQDQVLRLLGNLVEEKGNSTIFITHSLGIVREWTNRVYVMYAGSMVEAAPTKELFSKPLHPYTQGLMKAVPKLTGEGIAEGVTGRIPNYLTPPSGCRFHPRCPHVMPICKEKRPPFFDVGNTHQVACFLYKE